MPECEGESPQLPFHSVHLQAAEISRVHLGPAPGISKSRTATTWAILRCGQSQSVYHSHPNCDAYFSQTDLKNSCPRYSFVVLSIRNSEFHHANSWVPNLEQTAAAGEELIY